MGQTDSEQQNGKNLSATNCTRYPKADFSGFSYLLLKKFLCLSFSKVKSQYLKKKPIVFKKIMLWQDISVAFKLVLLFEERGLLFSVIM
jgi:hypothetical protein